MGLVIILCIVLIFAIAYVLMQTYSSSKVVDEMLEDLSNQPMTTATEIIVNIPTNNAVGQYIQAAAVENILGDREFAERLYVQMLEDVFGDGMNNVAVVEIGINRFNDIANNFNFPSAVNTDFTITSDNNNVHDGHLQDKLVERYKRLLTLNGDIRVDKAIAELRHHSKHQASQHPYKVVLDTMLGDGYLTSLNDSERNILAHVWHRAKQNPNVLEAFDTAMLDCYKAKTDTTHCITGRVSRLLECFTKTDPDQILNEGAVTVEILRKEIHDRAGHLMTSKLEQLDPDTLSLFNAGDDVIGNQVTSSVIDQIKAEYIDLVKPSRLNKILDDIRASII